MHIELLDDCGFHWEDVEPHDPLSTIKADDLASWFWLWALERRKADALGADGLFLIHAHGRFTSGAHRQDLQGIEILKHIRLTPGLETVNTWHAIVYSFEPLEQILSRKPGSLILTSPGVTFLRLPAALALRNALVHAYSQKKWNSLSLTEILADLGMNNPAAPGDRTFRPYVASDYTPPDSAHQISNWWGIYEMYLAFSGIEFPEYSRPESLPEGVRNFVLRLDSKKARWLEASRVSSGAAEERLAEFTPVRLELTRTAAGKTIVYVDDEADNGWLHLLNDLLNQNVATPLCQTVVPYAEQLRLPDKTNDEKNYKLSVKELARWVNRQRPALLILDLRLLGAREAYQDPHEASGMDLAREVRRRNPYLPILLFTASNKAETLLISRSLDVDDYWMKPGLGEHRGLRSREDDLIALAAKLDALLGEDYSWLQRVAGELRAIEKRRDAHWWEQTVQWPGPEYQGASPTLDTQHPDKDIRKQVLSLLHPILYTTRIIFRLNEMFGQPARGAAKVGSSRYIPPESLVKTFRDALFNQVGQLIELVHDLSRDDPFGCRTSNGILGGYFDGAKASFVFRRRDWWAFRLFAFRNQHTHRSDGGSSATDNDVKTAISDLFAWLTIARIQVQPLPGDPAKEIANAMAATPKLIWRKGRLPEVYPVLRLDVGDPTGVITAKNSEVELARCGNELAVDSRFRDQFAMRPEFGPLVEKSWALLRGS